MPRRFLLQLAGTGLVSCPWLTAQVPQQADPEKVAQRMRALEQALQAESPPAPGGMGQQPSQGAVPLSTGPATGLGTQTGPFQLVGVSVDLMTAIGTSTEPDPVIQQLQGGHHDPRRRGFTLEQAELQLNGAVDPYFRGQFVLVSTLDAESNETIVEIEEAWLATQQLPYNLMLRGGQYLTNFGRMNPVHPHLWDFQDQPVVMSRFFGEDGLRGPGLELSWLAPTPTYFELFVGAQDPHGETMASFLSSAEAYEERPVGGRLFPEEPRQTKATGDMVWHGRATTSVDFGPATTFIAGASVVYGPNATGEGVDTTICGADFMLRWRPLDNRRGYPFFKLQGEFLARRFEAAAQVDERDPNNPFVLPSATLRDLGGYLYAVYGFDVGWAFGLRGEWAGGTGQSYVGGGEFDRNQDPWRADRFRGSALLSYQTSEYSRVRLQYNYDDSAHIDRIAHSLWLNFEVLVGPHQPHSY